MFPLCSLIRRKSEFCKVHMSCGLAHLLPHLTFINSILVFSEEIPSLRSVVSCQGQKVPWPRFPPCSRFPCVLAPQHSVWDSLAIKAGWLREPLIRKARAASSGWRGEFLLGFCSSLPSPSPCFLLFAPSSPTPTSVSLSAVSNILSPGPLTYTHTFVTLCILVLGSENVVAIEHLLKLSLIFLLLFLHLLKCQIRHYTYTDTHKYEKIKQ